MFDELRIKSLLKKELTGDKYLNLPYKIQKDPRIVSHLIKSNPSAVSVIDRGVDITSYVLEDYSLVQYLSSNQLNSIILNLDLSKINMTKELFDKLFESNQDKVFKKLPKICLDLFELSKRRELIYDITFARARYSESSDLYDLFTEEELKEIILNLEEKDLIYLFDSSLVVKKYVTSVVSALDESSLILLYDRCPGIYEFLPNDNKDIIDLNKAGDDIGKISSLSENAQVRFYMNNLHLLRLAPEKVIRSCVENMDNLTCEQFIMISGKAGKWTDLHKMSKEELDKVLAYSIDNLYWYCYFHEDRRTEHLQRLVFEKLELVDDFEKRNKFKLLYKSLELEKVIPPKRYGHINGEKYQISKLLLDENVIKNNSPELLQKFKDTLDNKVLAEILSNAYGEHVKEIFESRPYLGITDLENLSIFSYDIYNVLGKSFVDYALNCNLKHSNYLIYQLAHDKELLQVFSKYFNTMTSGIEKLDINIISNLLDKFLRHKDVLKDIDYDNLTEERKRNIELLLSDRYEIAIHVRTLEDLDNYIEIRNKRFIELVDTFEYADDVRDSIFAYVTGRDVVDKGGEYTLENLTVEQVIKTFDINRIINDEELIQKMNLNKDDVAVLLLLNEISRIRDIEVLKNTFKSLISRKMDSNLLASTFDKIKKYCIEDVKNNLVSLENIEKMEKRVINGIEVVSFEGEPFSMLISVTGTNLSDEDVRSQAITGKKLLNSWLHKEDGLVTISTALVSSDTSIYPADDMMWCDLNGHITLVFDNSVEIVGMGGSDISSSHVHRSKKHAFNYIMNNDFGFSSMDELKKRANKNARENDLPKFNTEVTISRYFEDIRRDNSGKRVMPIGVYVVGDITPEVLETARVFNSYYEQNGLGKFRIIQINPSVYKGEGRIVEDSLKKRGDEVNGKNI